MGRPKGSKNKNEVKKEQKEIKEKVCSHCEHEKSFHYGSLHNWCNKQNCRCEAWRE